MDNDYLVRLSHVRELYMKLLKECPPNNAKEEKRAIAREARREKLRVNFHRYYQIHADEIRRQARERYYQKHPDCKRRVKPELPEQAL